MIKRGPEEGLSFAPNRYAAGAAVALATIASAATFGLRNALGAESQPACQVSSLVAEGFNRDGQPFVRLMGMSNCRLVQESVNPVADNVVCHPDIKQILCSDGLARKDHRNPTWYQWKMKINGKEVVREHGSITDVRLPSENAKITDVSYTTGYGSVTSTEVNFPNVKMPEADMIVTPADEVVTQGVAQ